jgi:hypothetical protein
LKFIGTVTERMVGIRPHCPEESIGSEDGREDKAWLRGREEGSGHNDCKSRTGFQLEKRFLGC